MELDHNELRIAPFRVGDSPWFWLALFGSVAIVGLSIIGGKYTRRQTRLEQRYQNRVQIQAQHPDGQPGHESAPDRVARPMSALPARPKASLAPLVALFALLAVCGYAGLYVSYRRHLRAQFSDHRITLTDHEGALDH